MKFISGILLPSMEIRWPRRAELASVGLPLTVGFILALLTLVLGPITLPIVFFVLFVLPWLLPDPFRLFIWLIVTWPILSLFVRIPLPAGIPDLSYDRILVLLLAGIIIIEALLLKRKLVRVTSLDILVMGYLVAQLSSRLFVLWFGGIGTPNLNGLLDIILIPLILYWIVKNLLVSRSHLKWFLYALLIACLLICLTGLYEQVMGVRIFFIRASLGGTEEQYFWQDVEGGRAAGAMGNPAIYGAILGTGILAGVCCWVDAKRWLTRIALVAIIGVLLCGVFASYTRSAWLSVFAVLFVAQFLVGGLWKWTFPILMLGLLLMALIWDNLSNYSIVSQAMDRALHANSLPVRVDLLYLGWERFLDRPFLGWGSGAFNIFGLMRYNTSSHNIYLTFLVDGGLFLFFSFIAVMGCLLIRVIRVYRATEEGSLERNVLVVMAGSIMIYLISGMLLELRYFVYFNALFWVCVGVIDFLDTKYSGSVSGEPGANNPPLTRPIGSS